MPEIVLKRRGRKKGTRAVKYGSISAKAVDGKMENIPGRTSLMVGTAWMQKDFSSADPTLLSLFSRSVLPG